MPSRRWSFADEGSPVFLAAVGDLMSAMVTDEPKIADAFKSGKGVGWNERSECLFCGTARFFRTTYKHHLVQAWLPALEGMVARLEHGAKVADVGCGHGVSTALMAKAFPKSQFAGFDAHPGSIEAAMQAASADNIANATFSVETAKTFPAGGYDLVCFFDCLHDMGDPVGALKHVRETIAPDGTCMLVEPFAAWAGGRARVVWLTGGIDRGDPCQAGGHHGFAGLDAQVVGQIVAFASSIRVSR